MALGSSGAPPVSLGSPLHSSARVQRRRERQAGAAAIDKGGIHARRTSHFATAWICSRTVVSKRTSPVPTKLFRWRVNSPSRLARPARTSSQNRGLVRSSVTFAASKRAASRFQQSRRLDSRPFPAANGAPQARRRVCTRRGTPSGVRSSGKRWPCRASRLRYRWLESFDRAVAGAGIGVDIQPQ